ncbi:hypothetical protein GN956_G26935, partial [Arapaima gigas]
IIHDSSMEPLIQKWEVTKSKGQCKETKLLMTTMNVKKLMTDVTCFQYSTAMTRTQQTPASL